MIIENSNLITIIDKIREIYKQKKYNNFHFNLFFDAYDLQHCKDVCDYDVLLEDIFYTALDNNMNDIVLYMYDNIHSIYSLSFDIVKTNDRLIETSIYRQNSIIFEYCKKNNLIVGDNVDQTSVFNNRIFYDF